MITAQHLNASPQEVKGNKGVGRYFFLTGSDARAREISQHFQQVSINKHPRHHDLYLGSLAGNNGNVDVAAISIGMGGPSADIIINELVLLGATRLLRVGTAASLQEQVKIGDLVIANAAVRDDKASWDYIYPEYPAIASFEYLQAAHRAVDKFTTTTVNTHFGIVHSKSSLYAREYQMSCMEEEQHYMKSMTKSGVLATEMECAQLFILSSVLSARLCAQSLSHQRILSGAILAIIGDNKEAFSSNQQKIDEAIDAAIRLGIDITLEMSLIDEQEKASLT